MVSHLMIQCTALLALTIPILAMPIEDSNLFKRQCGVAGNRPAQRRQVKVESYAPRQTYKFSQRSDPIDCGSEGAGCEIAASRVEGKTFSYSAGGSINGWISGGYEVGEYVESGQMANCQGSADDVICVYYRQAYTEYMVQTVRSCFAQGGDKNVGEPFLIYSPNKDQGNGWICAQNDECRSKDFEFDDALGWPSGGPRSAPSSDLPANIPARLV